MKRLKPLGALALAVIQGALTLILIQLLVAKAFSCPIDPDRLAKCLEERCNKVEREFIKDPASHPGFDMKRCKRACHKKYSECKTRSDYVY